MHFSDNPKSKIAFHTNKWEIMLTPTQTRHKEENTLVTSGDHVDAVRGR